MTLPFQLQPTRPPSHPAVKGALKDCQRAFWSIAVFSAAVNLLMLAGPLYMLQVYDRVLASRSIPTLIALSLLLVGAYAFQGLFDFIRSRIVVRAASMLDERLDRTVHAAVVRIAVQSRRAGIAQQPLRDLDQIRSFLTGLGPIAIVDLPWMPIYLAVCFLIHPVLGLVSLAGAIALFSIALATERSSRTTARNMAQGSGLRSATIEAHCRNSESAVSMGMQKTLASRWAAANEMYLSAITQSTDVAGAYASFTRVLRMLLQSSVLGLGAYLVIRQEMSAGSMIAASLMMGRALAPVETAVANWRSFVSARQSVKRLSETLLHSLPSVQALDLPAPRSRLEVSQLWVAPPLSETAIVRGVSFSLNAGEALGIIGPSGAGKTSLVRSLVGVWPAVRGTVRIDGATLDQWDSEALGAHIGFLTQPAELFEGTIAENIARMDPEYDSKAVLQAARAAGAHEMILRLPHGYNTAIGDGGVALSAGQRQRIALARALYGDPFLVVLDEPHSNLDSDGEHALTEAILAAKSRGAIVIMIAHRPAELVTCDKVLVVANGVQHAFGAHQEIMARIAPPRSEQAAAGRVGAHPGVTSP